MLKTIAQDVSNLGVKRFETRTYFQVNLKAGQTYILHIIPPVGGGITAEAYALDVNSSGQVVGRSGGTPTSGFVWSPATGTMTRSTAMVSIAEDGTCVSGSDIYSAGGLQIATIPIVDGIFAQIRPGSIQSGAGYLSAPVVVGRAVDPSISAGPASCTQCIAPAANVAFIYDSVNGSRSLDVLGVPDSFFARGINGSGRIVGETNNTGTDTSTRAFVFDLSTGTTHDLGTLRADNLGTASARAVNPSGTVVGYATSPSLGDEHAFLWTDATGMTDLGTLGATTGIFLNRSRAFGINTAGVVVGESTTPSTVSPLAIRHPFVWDPVNGMRDLNDLVAMPTNYELVRAVAISDSGWICGYGVGSAGNGFYSGFALEPIVSSAPSFQRGDCNDDGAKNIADPVRLLTFLFPPTPTLATLDCEKACDANDDGFLNISDAIAMLSVLFPTTTPLEWTAPDICGLDPTADGLSCSGYTNCP